MIEKKEVYRLDSQEQLTSSPQSAVGDSNRDTADATSPAAVKPHNTMLANVREMLSLAIEGAFDLRTGRQDSPHLRRFHEMLDEQKEILKSLENGVFTTDPGLLTRRAQEALHGFAAAVRHEIIEDVRPGMNPTVFDGALQRMTDRAVMAGAAFASLDLALEQL